MDQLTLPDTRGLKPRKSRDLLADALEWIDQNRAGWKYAVAYAHDDARNLGRVRIKKYIEDLRDEDGVHSVTGSVFKLPNAFSAPFGRILAAWYPDLADSIPMHHSKVDGCVVPPVPRWCKR
jgi:hypothetical protein